MVRDTLLRLAILIAEIDRAQIVRGKYDLDVVGHYARPDIFQLHVDQMAKQPVTVHGTGPTDKQKPGFQANRPSRVVASAPPHQPALHRKNR